VKLKEHSAFASFVQKRSRLLERLTDLGDRLDAWIQSNENEELTVTEVAHLEGLLSGRRDLLNELAALDETFMTNMLTLIAPEAAN
jgi:hypothetical protein